MTHKELKEIVLDSRQKLLNALGKGGEFVIDYGEYSLELCLIGKKVLLSIKSNDEEDDFYEEALSKYFDDAWQMLIGKLYIGAIFAE